MATELMVDTKPWWTSKTTIALIVGILITMFSIFKRPEIAESIKAEAAVIEMIWVKVATLIVELIALYGRLTATTKLTK